MIKKAILMMLLYSSTSLLAQTQQPQKLLPVVSRALLKIDPENPAYHPEAAYKLFLEGAQQGSSLSMNALGVMHSKGLGTTVNFDEAIKWFEKAARNGYSQAWLNWGNLYQYGSGRPQNFKRAYEIFSEGTEKGDANAQYSKGYLTYKGFGCPQNYEQAALLFKKSAAQGNLYSMYMLGICYRNGYGLTRDTDSATYWLKLSAEKGFRHAKYELDRENPENSFDLTASKIHIAKTAEKNIHIHTEQKKALGEKIKLNKLGNKMEGSYSGYVIRYDWSGKHIIGQSKLDLYLSVENNQLSGQWIEDDTTITAVKASVKDSVLTFSNTRYMKKEHYGKKKGVNFEFRDATLKLISLSDSVFLAGKLQLFSLDQNEPEKPIYINLVKDIDEPIERKILAANKVNTTKLLEDNSATISTEENLQVYPNPFSSSFQLAFGLSTAGRVNLVLSDLLGKVHYKEILNLSEGQQSRSISAANLPAGTYVLKAVYDGKVKTQIVIKH